MTRKPVVLRRQARRDVEEAAAYYVADAGGDVARAFLDALDDAWQLLGEFPAIGSPRYADATDIPGLRSWPMRPFPYLLFYVEQETEVDVWRVLHAARDIPAWLPGELDD